MTVQHVDIVFQIIAFLLAISVHESAHAWMANLRGDPTARMLGRITLNPIKHIDPIGTVLLPIIAALTPNMPMLGWAKPTPVNPNNFRNPVLDDILTSVVGPISNFAVAVSATTVLLIMKLASPAARTIIDGLVRFEEIPMNSLLSPFCLLVYRLVIINVFLGVFNLIPVPPLDGSHVLRHFLPEPVRRVYDMIGMIGLVALVYLAPGFLSRLVGPVFRVFRAALLGT